jgi:hypothetical protein
MYASEEEDSDGQQKPSFNSRVDAVFLLSQRRHLSVVLIGRRRLSLTLIGKRRLSIQTPSFFHVDCPVFPLS